MAKQFPVVTIQCDWNEVVRLPNSEAWVSYKYLNENSVHGKLKTSKNEVDGKNKITLSDEYQFISQGNQTLLISHKTSGLKIAFVAPTMTYKICDQALLSVSVADDFLGVASFDADKFVVWDSRTGEIILDLEGHGGPVYKCRLFPSGIVIISGGADGSCRIWSAESGICPVTLKGHTMAVNDIGIIDKGRNVVSVSKDGYAKLWDVGESKCLDNIAEGLGPLNCCTLTTTDDVIDVENPREVETGNKLLIIGCENGTLAIYHIAKREQIACQQLDAACNSVIVVNKTIVAGCSDGKVIFLTTSGAVVDVWHESASPVLCLAPLQNSMYAIGRQDGTCTVVSTEENFKAMRIQLTGSDCDGIRDLAYNGKWIFAACRDGYVRKYDFKKILYCLK